MSERWLLIVSTIYLFYFFALLKDSWNLFFFTHTRRSEEQRRTHNFLTSVSSSSSSHFGSIEFHSVLDTLLLLIINFILCYAFEKVSIEMHFFVSEKLRKIQLEIQWREERWRKKEGGKWVVLSEWEWEKIVHIEHIEGRAVRPDIAMEWISINNNYY